MYLPTEIWEATRSRSSRQGYFQISFPCKHCKRTKQYFMILLYEWSQRIQRPLVAPAGWGNNDASSCIQRSPPTSGRMGKESRVRFFPLSWVKRFLDQKEMPFTLLERSRKRGCPLNGQQKSASCLATLCCKTSWKAKLSVKWHNGSTALFTAASRTEG